jgi:hypothetical protein
MEAKSIFASRTLWANVIGGAVAIATSFGLDLDIDAEAQTAIVGGIMAVVNIVLRIVTKSPITLAK